MSTKRFFTICFVLIGIFVVSLFIIGLVQPKDITVSRSAFIQAPKEQVFKQMSDFRNWRNWSPWPRMDTSMKDSFAGPQGELGAIYHWFGDPTKTGEAELKATAINGTSMTFNFALIEPSKMNTSGTLSATDSANGTRATFSFTNHFDYPWNAMTIFMNLDNLLSKDFDSGLNNMKVYLEGHR